MYSAFSNSLWYIQYFVLYAGQYIVVLWPLEEVIRESCNWQKCRSFVLYCNRGWLKEVYEKISISDQFWLVLWQGTFVIPIYLQTYMPVFGLSDGLNKLFKCNNKMYLTLKLKAVSCKKIIIRNILHSFAWKLTIYLLIKMVSLKWTEVGVLIHNWFDWRLSFRDILEPPSHWIVSNLHICIVFLWLYGPVHIKDELSFWDELFRPQDKFSGQIFALRTK